jgi:hypothetical protein
MKKVISLFLFLSLVVLACDRGTGTVQPPEADTASLSFPAFTPAAATAFVHLALRCAQTEYPNKLSHVMNGPQEVLSPKALHPLFFGCFDWHSCVHGHWLLVKVLKTFPDLPQADTIRQLLDDHFTAEKVAAEVAYLQQSNRRSFERTYGWAWLLKLQEELLSWDDPDARRWARTLQPLADAFVQRYLDFLPKQAYPIRRGVHPNTAFGLIFALDYARQSGNKELEDLIVQRSRDYYLDDRDAPARWEPDGDDFLSPSLQEASLMLRVLPRDEFVKWFHRWLPDLPEGEPANLLTPPDVTDRSDPKIVHLDGLDLSRAWCMTEIAHALPPGDPAVPVLRKAAVAHAHATLPYIASGNYEGEHWLASFAVYMFTVVTE